MATEYQWDAALSWPFNPTVHFTNHTGETNSSLISRAALIYVPGQIPPPWPYLLTSAAISWLIATIAWTTASIQFGLDPHAPEKPSLLRHGRKPSIFFSALRTISLIITSARAPATHTIPSSFTTTAVAFSLIPNFLDRKNDFDNYSGIVILCTTTLFGLLLYEIKLTLPLMQENKDTASGYGFGRMALVGGACVRRLQRGESCKALRKLACVEGGGPGPGGLVAGFVSHKVALSNSQFVVQLFGFIGIAPALFYFARFLWRRDDKKNGAYTLIFKCLSCVMLTLVTTIGLLILAFGPGGTKYVDGRAMNGTGMGWTDCFKAAEPSDRYGFASLWFKQEWNKTVTEKLAILGLT